jgi:invasion protein IalB
LATLRFDPGNCFAREDEKKDSKMNHPTLTSRTARRPVFAALAFAAFSLAASPVMAQQAPAKPAPRAAPRAAPAKPAQQQAPAQHAPAPQQQAQGDTPPLIYSPWAKFCNKAPDPNAKQVCFTGRDARTETGVPVVAAALIEPEGEPKKILRITLPSPLQLQYGSRLIVDQNPPVTSPFFTCFANGCMADYEGTPDLIAKMKKGQQLQIQAININGSQISFPLPLSDFAKANEGPPSDPKKYEEDQAKLQAELQKRAEEQRKKLEAQGQGGQPAAPPR